MFTARGQVIIPMTRFSCNGKITGYVISLGQNSNSNNYPRIQIWRPAMSPSSYRLENSYTLAENTVGNMEDYSLARVSFTANSRIEFQPDDIIGYYIPNNPRYSIWNAATVGYVSYFISVNSEPTNIGIIGSRMENRQPLIQVLYGRLVHVLCILL